MSQMQKRRQASRRGVHVFRWPDTGDWDVFVESEGLLGPRGVTRQKREAVNFAYRIAKNLPPFRATRRGARLPHPLAGSTIMD